MEKRLTTQESLEILIRDGRVSFHNSIGLDKSTLTEASKLARSQEVKVFIHMSMGHRSGTPSQIHKVLQRRFLIGAAVPITSIRRAMSNLVTMGYLVNTHEKKMGPMGRPEYIYEINENKILAGGTPTPDN